MRSTRRRASRPADGHTVAVVVAAHVINPSLYSKMPFDAVADVAPVTLIATSPWVVVVTPSFDKYAKLVKQAGIQPE